MRNGHVATRFLVVVSLYLLLPMCLSWVMAQQRTTRDGVYTGPQAGRGRAIYIEQCATCHGDALTGGVAPPLTGDEFRAIWGDLPLVELADKIRNTMPTSNPGGLSPQQTVDLVAHILQTGGFPAGQNELSSDAAELAAITLSAPSTPSVTPATGSTPTFPPAGNMAQVMRGILFPSSNIVFNVQTIDPGAVKRGPAEVSATAAFSWTDWGAGIYSPWEIVDFAAIALAESAPLLLTPGRRCENGKAVPVANDDWVQFTQELAEAGRAAYRASQSRSQEAVSEASGQVADACLNCHVVYRDKPGGTVADPSNKAARCEP
jgi:mono/diheme cytochrome c family protein